MNCEQCIFALFNGGVQDECKVRPIEVYTHTESGWWDLRDRICPYKRDAGWQLEVTTKAVRKEIIPTYEVVFNMEEIDATTVFEKFNNVRLPPERVIGYTNKVARIREFKEEGEKWDSFCGISVIADDVDPALDFLRNTKSQYVWFLRHTDFNPDLFYWLDEQVNDREWRFGAIHSENATIWSKRLFKLMPGMALSDILKALEPKDLVSNYDFITKSSKSNLCWHWERAEWSEST